MTKKDIVSKVKSLHLPKDSYIVFGSCPLTMIGLREANDIDLLVSEDMYEMLGKKGWQKVYKGPNDTPLVYDVFEAHNNWNFNSYNPTLIDLLANASEVDNIFFASISDVQKWKTASGRPEDFADLKLIEAYLATR